MATDTYNTTDILHMSKRGSVNASEITLTRLNVGADNIASVATVDLKTRPIVANTPQANFTVKYFINQIAEVLWTVSTLGLFRFYYRKWKCVPLQSALSNESPSALEAQRINPFTTIDMWQQYSRMINKGWKIARLGCALMLPLSIALLQLNPILNNVYGRTFSIATFLLSSGGVIIAGIFMAIPLQFRGRKGRWQWIKASQDSKFYCPETIQFWSILAVPISLMIYSAVFSISAVFLMAWNWNNSTITSVGRPENIVSSIFLTALAVMIFVLVYYTIRLANKIL